MKTVDYSTAIVIYDIIIGILMMLASGKIASYAGYFGGALGRYTKVSVFTLGSCITAVSGSVYLAFHLLRIGVD